MFYIDDMEKQELQQQDLVDRRNKASLNANPHCSDPYHPGCSLCDSDPAEQDED